MVYCEKKASDNHLKKIYDSNNTMINRIRMNKLIFCDIEQLIFRPNWISELALNLIKYFTKKSLCKS